MRTRVSLCDYIDEIYVPSKNTQDNNDERLRFRNFLDKALQNYLTDNQQKILIMYYIKKMPMPEIADLLGKNKSTVCRSIKTSTKKLRELSDICFF